MTRYFILCTITSTAAIIQAVLLGLVVKLAAIDLPQTTLHVPSLVAAVFDAVVLLALLLLVSEILIGMRQAGRTQNAVFLFLSALFLTALALSIYVLSSAWLLLGFGTTSLSKSRTACLIVAGMVLRAISVVLQGSISLMLLTAKQPEPGVSSDRYFMGTLGNSPRKTSCLGTNSPKSSIIDSTRHASVGRVFGPLGSKTRLLIANSLHAHDTQSQISRREPSLEIACRGKVEDEPRDVQSEDFPLPDSPTLPRATSVSSLPSGLPFPQMIGDVAVQSQIHPFFRVESPDPHPLTSPSTHSMAPPFAG